MQKISQRYLLGEEDSKRIDQMLSLARLFVTELIDRRLVPSETKDDAAFDEFEAYLERIVDEGRNEIEVAPDF